MDPACIPKTPNRASIFNLQYIYFFKRRAELLELKSRNVFMVSERSDFLREMFGRHLGFFRQSKVGERNKFLPSGVVGWYLVRSKTPALQATTFDVVFPT